MLNKLLNYYYINFTIIYIVLFVLIILFIIFTYKHINKIKEIYAKNKEIINYVIVGALTTLVSISSYWLFRFIISDYIILSIISWILAVLFAYMANRVFVFESKENKIIEEIVKFIGCRIVTLIMEVLLMMLFVKTFKIDDMMSKIILQFVVLILNYIFSKIFVFKGGKK